MFKGLPINRLRIILEMQERINKVFALLLKSLNIEPGKYKAPHDLLFQLYDATQQKLLDDLSQFAKSSAIEYAYSKIENIESRRQAGKLNIDEFESV